MSAPGRRSGPANVLAVASGKGGVGKTWLAITLAQAMAERGARVLVFDGDLGLANVDVQLGLGPTRDLTSALAGRHALAEVVRPVPAAGFDVIAGRSGGGGLAATTSVHLEWLGRALGELAAGYDRVLLDLGAGIDRTVRSMAACAGVGLVVTDEEPTALTDAYAYIKLTLQQRPDADLRVVVNAAAGPREGERTYSTLRRACETFLETSPPLAGVVRRDARVREAIRQQTPFLTRHPTVEAADDVRRLAQQLLEAR
jgi:flagellar biosynthesis protein FlhG